MVFFVCKIFIIAVLQEPVMTTLSVNLNKIALLRNQRDIGIPSVTESAIIVIEAGGQGVTVHPRPDERHIRYRDAYELAELVSRYRHVEYNIEGNPFTGRLMELMRQLKPDQATLVPDEPGANTSDHGWDAIKNESRLIPVVKELKELGIRVSLFMDPVVEQIEKAGQIGVDRVELYTEPYARAFSSENHLEETVRRYVKAADFAQSIGLELNAGHDLNLENLGKLLTEVQGIKEVSIGHALIADALKMGLEDAVKEYLKVIAKTE